MKTTYAIPRVLLLGLLALLASNCQRLPAHPTAHQVLGGFALQTVKFELVDSSRQRRIPVVAYSAAPAGQPPTERKLALLSHGYGGQNTDYEFVARNLVAHGYYVVSLQHELAADAPMPLTGDVYQGRYPFWERGVQNLLFVRQAMYQRYPSLNQQRLLLVGHSNGGDKEEMNKWISVFLKK